MVKRVFFIFYAVFSFHVCALVLLSRLHTSTNLDDDDVVMVTRADVLSRKTTSAYRRAVRWTSGNPERRKMNTRRWLKRPWTPKTVSLTVSAK